MRAARLEISMTGALEFALRAATWNSLSPHSTSDAGGLWTGIALVAIGTEVTASSTHSSGTVSVAGAMVLSLIVTFFIGYNRHSKDWCGWRMMPAVVLNALSPWILIGIFYVEFQSLLAHAPHAVYWVSGASAILAHTATDRVMKNLTESSNGVGYDWIIARETWRMRQQLTAMEVALCAAALEGMILTCHDLSRREKAEFVALIKTDPRNPMTIIAVFVRVGLKQVRVAICMTPAMRHR